MTVDVVNDQNEKIGSVELDPNVFGGRVNAALIWEAVVHQNAADRRGTHKTKTRGEVRGSGSKPWRQKGTGRARVGDVRTPLWRKGGTVFGPQPRSYNYALPRKMRRGALRAALAQRVAEDAVTVVDQLALGEVKTKMAGELLDRLGGRQRVLLVDVTPDSKLLLSVRNLESARLVGVTHLTARDVMDAGRVVVTRAAIEALQEALAR
ncbi:MAG: 50S ribosomal protein L4 [Vicinamibacterales bacterium]|jgi:large subunit ribosomal protein L4|nr:50S ribosomal protein L4 [Vicinamibacterales bacterium]MDP6609084.1 50S ribosomal protein L4 [Vicinamibacterales bacterium]HAK54420.1 50S ribosomal protein L4 [Acidobacteriota bacterium]|tara:strand:- start:2887 stop:3510 length:624 start_codon:yes stop_codon:yes gene_type:complete